MINTINQVTYLEVYFSKNRIFTMKACIMIRLHNQLRNKRKQARAELDQAQGTQSSYPFLHGGRKVVIVKLVVQVVAID